MWDWWPPRWQTHPRGQSVWGLPERTQSAKQLAGGSVLLRRSPEVRRKLRQQLTMAVGGFLVGL
jgi:hypothetical protein